ncbi:acetyl-CoA synthetase-like protein [Cristinia sonorae]|uniref:Acetyl-CoA synthetase-like protein n=1 Tax=Cristinia sonorae TaxID=1940300 RepID=A0A8K0URM1_9AGAR|nr:acetyl-CoA synthetase-like protein [Cristinia sonorae]
MSFRTHLTILNETASAYPDRPVFRVPVLAPADNGQSASEEVVEGWKVITYSQFDCNVRSYAKYWYHTLSADGIPPRSVIGLWLSGLSYVDALHIYSVARAGYVPQLFSLRLPSPEVIYELLAKGGARALIADSSFKSILGDAPVPVHVATEVFDEDVMEDTSLPELSEPRQGEDIVMIFHTSGSTSGSPKLVRCSYRWLNAMIAKANVITRPRNQNVQDVSVWMGSMSHIAQTFMLLGSLQHGSCTIQPTKIAFSSDELMDMAARCQLNRLNQFATFLATHLRASRQNPKLLQTLKDFEEVVYSGLALPREEEDWAYRNGLRIKNLFGSTECGAMMLSIGGAGNDARFLRPIEGTVYGFFPVTAQSEDDDDKTAAQHLNANQQLLEMVILNESGDCPDPLLRSVEDGHFHTGDLFIEAAPGSYVSRGRDDDWIKSENSLRCDTKAIEDNVRSTCGDLIAECIVVGNGRPSPALFIEPKLVDGVTVNEEKLKKDIIRKTRHFHSRRYLHERISSPKFIFVVPAGTLPRTATKGNIRRRAVEEKFKEMLDGVYGMSF